MRDLECLLFAHCSLLCFLLMLPFARPDHVTVVEIVNVFL